MGSGRIAILVLDAVHFDRIKARPHACHHVLGVEIEQRRLGPEGERADQSFVVGASSPVRNSRQNARVNEANTSDKRDFAPAFSLTAVWDNPPATG